MDQVILPGEPPVSITLRVSRRARRLSLRVSALDGRVTLTRPHGVSACEALDFAREREEWLRGHLARCPGECRVGHYTAIPYRGNMMRIVPGPGRVANLVDDTLVVPGDADAAGRRAMSFLRLAARDRFAEASDRYAALLGRSFTGITLRDPRSRWGSCSSRGRLMYSWRLIMAPDAVLDYVAAHEVAHLAEMNHSPRFWAVVGRLYGDTRAPRDWLRREGTALHRFRFAD